MTKPSRKKVVRKSDGGALTVTTAPCEHCEKSPCICPAPAPTTDAAPKPKVVRHG